MIAPNLQKMIGEAMKARDSVRLSTLRMLSSEFNYAKIDAKHDLTEEEELSVIKKEVKKRRDSIEAYQKAGRQDLVDSETAELKILEEFLPAQISDAELEDVVASTIAELGASSMADMGKVIGMVMGKVGATADGASVAALVRTKLGNG